MLFPSMKAKKSVILRRVIADLRAITDIIATQEEQNFYLLDRLNLISAE
jgi:hypothetical protein